MNQKIMVAALFCLAFPMEAWDDERDIESEIHLPGISKNVLNFRIADPLNFVEEFYVGLGFVLSADWKLGIIGEFENQALQTVGDLSREFHSNPDGSLGGISRERKEDSFTAGPLRNVLRVFVGHTVAERLTMGFSLGLGMDYDVWETVGMKYDHHFTTTGLIDILNPGVDDNRLTAQRFSGEIPIMLGFGFSMIDRPFVNRTDNVLDPEEFWYSLGRMNSAHRVHIGLFGAGQAPEGIPVLGASGISLGAFDGGGDQYRSEQTFIQDNTPLLKSYKEAHNEAFTWTKMRYDGMVETEFDLNLWDVPAFQSWYRLRFIPELAAWFEMTLYGATVDERATYYYTNIFGHVDGDYNIRTTTYSMGPKFNFGVQAPFDLDFRPVKEVQVRFQYTPKLGFHLLNYTAQYSESRLQNGFNVSFRDPLLSGGRFRMDHSHTVGVRFRFEPVPELRLTMSGTWTWATYSETTQLSAKDNIRHSVSGTGLGPYTQIPTSNRTEGAWNQTIASSLVLDWAVVPQFATLTMSWDPEMPLGNASDSNVINLANWQIRAVITYDSATARVRNRMAPEPVLEPKTADWSAEAATGFP